MSYIPVTSQLSLQLSNKPLHLPLDKDHSVSLSTLKSAFGPTAIGLKFQENHKVKIVACKNSKLFPPKVTPFVTFVVIKEGDNPQSDIPDSLAKTKIGRTLNASKQHNTNNSSSDSVSPEVSYQDVMLSDVDEYRLEYDLLGKYCQ
jgi:hypothetical protein